MERKNLYNGILIINKEKEYTSNDVVQIVKNTLHEKVGHTGTLDPNATGVLPLLIGNGTKISKYLINHDKIYESTLQLGVKTDTADGEGKIIKQVEVDSEIFNEGKIKNVFLSMIGKQKQVPPIYSAIKVNGKKLYDYARNGEKIEIPERQIEIYNLELIKIDQKKNQIKFKIECSKGTYIRTVCENIAEKLNTIGYMKELNRIQVGEFNINNSIKIEEIKKNIDNIEEIKNKIISIEEILKKFDKIKIYEDEYNKFINGVKLKRKINDGVYRVYTEKNFFLGTAIVKNELIKRDVIL
jgi:tRNA pseudouridine55 synthase